MSDSDSLRRLAVAGVLLAIVISVPSTLAFAAAFGWDLEATIFGEPRAILGRGAEAAARSKTSSIARAIVAGGARASRSLTA
jgi:hypothetical protein